MRRPRGKVEGEGFYHVVSRIGGKRFLIDEKGGVLGGGALHVRNHVEPLPSIGPGAEEEGRFGRGAASENGGAVRDAPVPEGAGEVGEVDGEEAGVARSGREGSHAI